MDRSDVIRLVAVTYVRDNIGVMVPTRSAKRVFCNVRSVTRTEFFDAGQNGLKPEWCFTVFAPDYEGEELVIYKDAQYHVYRTYLRQDEQIELYVERTAGTYEQSDSNA